MICSNRRWISSTTKRTCIFLSSTVVLLSLPASSIWEKGVRRSGTMTVLAHRNAVILKYCDDAMEGSLGWDSKVSMRVLTRRGVRRLWPIMAKDVSRGSW